MALALEDQESVCQRPGPLGFCCPSLPEQDGMKAGWACAQSREEAAMRGRQSANG